MEHPFPFGETDRTQAANDAAAFTSRALIRFGECASCLHTGYSEWPVLLNTRQVWRDALAAEALLFSPAYRLNNPPFAGFVTDDARPCGADAPPYGELKVYPAAAALFPMSGDRPRPGRIWAVGMGKDGLLPPERAFALEGAGAILAEAAERGIRLYAEACAGCDGQSWQLAAQLAMDALGSDDLTYRIDLAAEWLATGEVRAGRVRMVEIKNKTELTLNTRRRWLLPELNTEGFRRSAKAERPVTGVQTLVDAIEAVRGCVARRRPNESWPREVACLHAAVAADPSPVLRLIELAKPRDLHLWPLGSHQETVAGLRQTLRNSYTAVTVHEHARLPPDELETISRALHAFFSTNSPPSGLLFDISAASWLFRVAVRDVARLAAFSIVCQEAENRAYHKVWQQRCSLCHCCLSLPTGAQTIRRIGECCFGQ